MAVGLAMVLAATVSCSTGGGEALPVRGRVESSVDGASTTTVPVDPPSLEADDKSVLPRLDDPTRYGRGRARIRAIEGYRINEAEAWAFDSGWGEVQVVDADNPALEARPAVYLPSVIGLCERDGLVIRAWTGGW